MIDEEDVTLFAALWEPAGPISAVIGLAIIIALSVYACRNTKTCEAMACPAGQHPILAHGECLCAQPARTP